MSNQQTHPHKAINNTKIKTEVTSDQVKIWEHFQNEGRESFAGSFPRLDFLSKKIGKSKKILNIGAGSGYFEVSALKNGHDIYSLDLSQKTVDNLNKKGIKAFCGNITAMPFADREFDFVVASEVLEHLNDNNRITALKEILRVLKPKAQFIGTVPFNEVLTDNDAVCPQCSHHFHRWGHLKSFTLQSFKDEVSPILEVITVKRKTFVDFQRPTFFGKIKSLIKWTIGNLGSSIASPNIYFELQKRDN